MKAERFPVQRSPVFWAKMPEGYAVGAVDWIGLLLLCIILPIVMNWAIGKFMRAKGWIKEGDLKIDLG